ncbi:MAG: nitroreductase family protein [Thermodesulfobacteriota bacterium]
MTDKINIDEYRKQEHEVDKIFVDRWSPRAMSGEEIETRELMRLFEAARWAPSAFNNQPWRFLYAMRETEYWDKFFNLLVKSNQVWTKNAAALMVVISKETFDYNGKPARTHSFDAGAAWVSLALQGSIMGLVVHGMQGFDYDRAKTELNVPDGYTIEAMVAVGRAGNIANLPEELQEREFPSDRKKIDEIAFEGGFKE